VAIKPSTSDVAPAQKFQLVGGDLCLDFTNTMGGHRSGIAREKLNSYDDFTSWCRQAGIVTEHQASSMRRHAAEQPHSALSVLSRARDVREAIYRIFMAVIETRKPKDADLGQLNSELARAQNRLRLSACKDGAGFAWNWTSQDGSLDEPLGPIARAAADLLTNHHTLAQVRQCGGENCGWLFIDSSKNHSRRWCDMRDCGNRAKVRRHRQKLHRGLQPPR
jgi:predicted RNA-binding Zn ribbon-like protein